jgi:hypothetical protein
LDGLLGLGTWEVRGRIMRQTSSTSTPYETDLFDSLYETDLFDSLRMVYRTP